jgi:hypothetical protein
MNNGAYSDESAEALTEYIGREDVMIAEGDRGWKGEQVLTPISTCLRCGPASAA